MKYQGSRQHKITAFFAGIFLLLASAQGFSQILEPTTWRTDVSKKEAKVGETIELIFLADIQRDWYLYSSDFDPDLGPLVTTFQFEKNDSYELVGEIKPIGAKTQYDDLWEGDISKFYTKGEFRQKVKVLKKDFTVNVQVSFQTCSDIDGKCINSDDEFSFGSNDIAIAAAPVKEEEAFEEKELTSSNENTPQTESEEEKAVTETPQETPVTTTSKEKVEKSSSSPSITNFEEVNPEIDEGHKDLLSFMLFAFLGGLAAIFTPCVFPMIPLTVSFFTKGSENKAKGRAQALAYGISIILIYTIVGFILTPIAGPEAANIISTHWLPNLLFFSIFIVFALSFFGMFEIVLPNSLVNKIDQQAEKGGFLGSFFMAFTLVLVSFSCTGPIVGSILLYSAGGEIIRPAAGMFAFAMAFALPFTFFAFFPQTMNKLPKSGGWLNSVKVTLGFIELAFAFKFLSMVDLVYHWGILDRDINVAIWIAIFTFMGLYYLGKIRLPHDSPISNVSVPRLLLALLSFTFVIYLIPGMFGAPLKVLSGILPPQTRHSFDLHQVVRDNAPTQTEGNTYQLASDEEVKYKDKFELPHGLNGYFELEQGLAAAKKAGKPVFIDFTGHGCANCRKMEDNVWVAKPVLERLKKDYVVIALYVDDPTALPESDWITSAYDNKVKKTIGQKNMAIQIDRFRNNAQPFYVLLDYEGNLLVKPQAYDLDVNNFVDFLDSGLKEFNNRTQNLANN
ncbi:LptF/LptG family permease [Rapidithrix thailandica]|uniref:LptF/LptG family permease n=1 Tax=Rapidithrix thailandica TaxID=413964 RepID=A0AAW9SBC8_9BACT